MRRLGTFEKSTDLTATPLHAEAVGQSTRVDQFRRHRVHGKAAMHQPACNLPLRSPTARLQIVVDGAATYGRSESTTSVSHRILRHSCVAAARRRSRRPAENSLPTHQTIAAGGRFPHLRSLRRGLYLPHGRRNTCRSCGSVRTPSRPPAHCRRPTTNPVDGPVDRPRDLRVIGVIGRPIVLLLPGTHLVQKPQLLG